MTPSIDQLAVNTIRTLAMDGVQKANSGHPGAPMGAAPMAYVLWTRFLRHAPSVPDWPDRDRFVLSAGHASMLLYALLHLTGYDLNLHDLKSFRQWGSRTPGHPEHGLTPGVEATTGPLGQGFANAVGMAIAERRLAAEFNRPDHAIIDHRTYVIASDGDLQEGIASEAASLAGHLRLGKLIVLWDDNQIQLDGPTDMAWSEDVLARFVAYGWDTRRVVDGNDLAAIEGAVEAARADERPSLIAVRTHIGYGSPNRQDTQKAHGSPLGEDEVRLTKQAYGWDPDAHFLVPDDVGDLMGAAVPAGERHVADWEARYYRYRDAFPKHAAELRRREKGLGLAPDWDAGLKTYAVGEDFATRQASQAAIQALAGPVPELFGGAADLSESNLTLVKDGGDFSAEEAGRNLWFGVREHAMGGIANGIAYHGGFIPYAGTFLNFSDYMRGSVRLAALAGLQVIYVWTHDSVGLGEDGPTHQPVEHYAALRAMPNLWLVRPGDANEATAAWALAVQRTDGPVALALTRQKLPTLAGTSELAREGVARGGYVLRRARGEEAGTAPELLLMATGSELQLAFAAAEALEGDGIGARVVSLPCWEAFDAQDEAYRDSVIPRAIRKRVTIEAGASIGWERYAGDEGAVLGIDHFGASAPAGTIFEKLGFTSDRVTDVARRVLRDGLSGRVPTLDPGHQPAGLGLGATGAEAGNHPSLDGEESGVERTSSSDPGHS
ncbi:MAG TPA: transketolase [Candidatus Limnocylindria bacterium]|nr:transketolase [Candidatus Limnocylindria bacterium]